MPSVLPSQGGGVFRSTNNPAPEASPAARAKGWEGFLEEVTSQLSPEESAGGTQAMKRGRVTGRGSGRGYSGIGIRGCMVQSLFSGSHSGRGGG